MKLYTSNFAAHGKHPQAVAITVRPPMFIPGIRHLDLLAPTWKMVDDLKSGRCTEEQYKVRYLELIKKKCSGDPRLVLMSLKEGDVLLCYEKPGEFCHRQLAADFLKSVEGVEVEELS